MKNQMWVGLLTQVPGIITLPPPIQNYFLHIPKNHSAAEVEWQQSIPFENGKIKHTQGWTVAYGSQFTQKQIRAHCRTVENWEAQSPTPDKRWNFGPEYFDSQDTSVSLALSNTGWAIYGLVQEKGIEGKVFLISTENAIDPATLVKYSWEQPPQYESFYKGNTQVTIESIPNDVWVENRIESTYLNHDQLRVSLIRSDLVYDASLKKGLKSRRERSRKWLYTLTFLCESAP